jgi:hypothetical protein
MLAFLVAGTTTSAVIAASLKLYGVLALLFHPRRLLAAAGVLALTLPLLPWQLYLEHGLGADALISTGWNGSAWRWPILIPPTLIALWVLRHHGAEWFIVPAIFPGTQFYYVSTAMPAVGRRTVVAALLAIPVPAMTPLVVCVLAIKAISGHPAMPIYPRGRGDPGLSIRDG